jgi:hypothetical protein
MEDALTKMGWLRWAVLVTLVAAAPVLGAGRVGAAGDGATGSKQRATQACLERWNWMHYSGFFDAKGSVRAWVRVQPCRVEVAAFATNFFSCSETRFGGIACALHASGTLSSTRLRHYNARLYSQSGRIVLDHSLPDAQVTKPGWVQRYPVIWGLVIPFDGQGKLRPGLRLSNWPGDPDPLACTVPARKGEHWWTKYDPQPFGCGGGLFCFAPPAAVHLACAGPGGPTMFYRGLMHVLRY